MHRMFTAFAAAVTATLLSVSGASATIFTKDYHDAGVWNAFDDEKQTYSMKFTDDGSKDGFWLVVSAGQNPKTHATEYAILYGDRAADRITAYTYDGQNSSRSFQDGTKLATYENAFSTSGGMTLFSLDVADINAAYDTPDWQGVQFGPETGIWFHQTAGTEFTYDDAGDITSFGFDNQVWLDTSLQGTNVRTCRHAGQYYCGTSTTPTGGGSVPAPGGLALILIGLAGFGMRRKA